MARTLKNERAHKLAAAHASSLLSRLENQGQRQLLLVSLYAWRALYSATQQRLRKKLNVVSYRLALVISRRRRVRVGFYFWLVALRRSVRNRPALLRLFRCVFDSWYNAVVASYGILSFVPPPGLLHPALRLWQ